MKHSFIALLALFASAALAAHRETVDSILATLGRAEPALCGVVCPAEQAPLDEIRELARRNLAVHVITSTEQTRKLVVQSLMKDSTVGSRVMVERLPLSSLPYRTHLLNVLIVDASQKPKKYGLHRDELERVVAPGGVIAMHTRKGWQLSKKPRLSGSDDWTHPNKDATGNRVTYDSLIQPPFSYQWIDGVIAVTRCKGWVASNGRVFIQSTIEPENLGLLGEHTSNVDYLTARDAFNGLVIWKRKIGPPPSRDFFEWIQGVNKQSPFAALAVNDKAVFAVREDKVVAFDVATGTELFQCEHAYTPWSIRLTGDVLLTTGTSADPGDNGGGIEAFDVNDGSRRWSVPLRSNDIVASSSLAFVLSLDEERGGDSVVALDLKNGHTAWTFSSSDANDGDLRLLSCGEEYVLVNSDHSVYAVSAANGKALWHIDSLYVYWGPVVDGTLWINDNSYDVMTGRKVASGPNILLGENVFANEHITDFWCPLPSVSNNILI
ncbi:MAG: PQQ-binding-like beta-propeller repeat protein, partial [Chitinivibrionales bacterium]|nr:PQQ-binding-like beta-propeller repeat protein [Chitinivibrionales bacterium]